MAGKFNKASRSGYIAKALVSLVLEVSYTIVPSSICGYRFITDHVRSAREGNVLKRYLSFCYGEGSSHEPTGWGGGGRYLQMKKNWTGFWKICQYAAVFTRYIMKINRNTSYTIHYENGILNRNSVAVVFLFNSYRFINFSVLTYVFSRMSFLSVDVNVTPITQRG